MPPKGHYLEAEGLPRLYSARYARLVVKIFHAQPTAVQGGGIEKHSLVDGLAELGIFCEEMLAFLLTPV